MTIPFQFFANAVWLDFVNTELSDLGRKIELLDAPGDLQRWALEVGLIGRDELQSVANSPAAKENAARLSEARSFRSTLRTSADALAKRQEPKPETVRYVNSLLHDYPARHALKRAKGGWQLRRVQDAPAARAILALIAEDFARFIETADLSMLRACEGEGCRAYFYDTSKNHARRWCSMEYCGNRAKAASHRARHRN